MKLQRVSHLITDLRLEDGIVIGELEVLGTQRGKDLRALIEGGVTVGVSSRGLGSVSEEKDGTMIVSDDFEFQTFDVVADPAITSAFPDVVTEQTKPTGSVVVENLTDAVKPDAAKPVEAAAATADAAVDSGKPAGSSDVQVTKAQNMKKYMKKAEELTAMKEANEKLNFVCKDLGFRLFCERQIHGHPDLKGVMESFNSNDHADLDAVDAWVKPFVEQRDTLVESKRVNRETQVAAIENKLSALLQENASLKEKNAGLEASLTEAKVGLELAEETISKAVTSRQKFMLKYEQESNRCSRLVEENSKLKEESKKSLTESVGRTATTYLEARFGAKTDGLALAKTMLVNWNDTTPKGLNALAKIVEESLVKNRTVFNVRENLHRLPGGTMEFALRDTLPSHPRSLAEDRNLVDEPGLQMGVREFNKMAGIKE
jgi:hypothetical protein